MGTDQNLHEQLDLWYISMREQDKEKAIRLKKELESTILEATEPILETTYNLLQVRFYLLLKDYTGVLQNFSDVGSVRDLADHQLKYYYYFFNGIFLYDNKRYEDAVDSYLKAEPYLKKGNDNRETAEFKYKLATAYHRADHLLLSVYEAREALALFQKEYNFTRCADCENLLGANIKYIERYDIAEKHYQKALKLVGKVGDLRRKSAYYKNLGALYSEQNLSESAINCLKKAYELMGPEEYTGQRIRNVYLLTKEHFRAEKTSEACEWLEKGIKLSFEQEDGEHLHRFKMLEAKYYNPLNYEKAYREGIDFLQENKLWEYVMEYSEELAVYYREKGQLESAVEYYDLTIKVRKIIEKKGVLL